MAYSWLSDPEPILQPLERDPRPFAEAWPERLARPLPPIYSTMRHEHDFECLIGEAFIAPATKLWPAMRLQRCRVTGQGQHPDDQAWMAFLGFVE